MPYPPNLSITPDKTIDLQTGASTCAFNSHKCRPYIGNFTRNTNKNQRQNNSFNPSKYLRVKNLIKNFNLTRYNRPNKKGREPTIV